MNHNFDPFQERLKEYSIRLSRVQEDQFDKFYDLLIETNRVMNLTAITEWDEVTEKHFLDSLAIVPILAGESKCLDFNSGLRVMDVGTGAGFPGIPLKIVFPELQMTLSDSLNKRVRFLQTVIEELNLKKISALHGRAENIAKMATQREQYDLVVSRAVANLSTLTEYCLPFVKIGGFFVAYKSEACDEEVAEAKKAIEILGGELLMVKKFRLGESGRAFIVISKQKMTPKRYPRKAGTPSKEPLKS